MSMGKAPQLEIHNEKMKNKVQTFSQEPPLKSFSENYKKYPNKL